jgi:quercetin dioxygenase-like cupin family protein
MNTIDNSVASDTVPARNGAGKRSRPVGVTTGSARRPAQHVTGAVLAFDLDGFVRDLRADEGWPAGDPNTVTLVKEPSLRVVVVALRAGGRMKEHHASGRVTIQTIDGHTRLHLTGRVVDLPLGHLVALEPGLAHDVEALEASAILLTIAWPVGTGSS